MVADFVFMQIGWLPPNTSFVATLSSSSIFCSYLLLYTLFLTRFHIPASILRMYRTRTLSAFDGKAQNLLPALGFLDVVDKAIILIHSVNFVGKQLILIPHSMRIQSENHCRAHSSSTFQWAGGVTDYCVACLLRIYPG